MRDAYELLYQKEADLNRLRREIESLTIVAPLLAEDNVSFYAPDGQKKKPAEKAISSLPESRSQTPVAPRARFWTGLKRRR
jgi:hypothetical protein